MRFYGFLLFVGIVASTPFFIHAQSASEVVALRQAQLRQELEIVEKEIAVQQAILKEKQNEGASIERDIAILNAKISEAKLKIKAKTIAIEGLSKDIGKKNETIKDLEKRIEKNKESFGELVRRAREMDSYSMVEIVLAEDSLADFFGEADAGGAIRGAMKEYAEDITDKKELTELEKDNLDKKRKQETDARVAVEAEKRVIEKAEAEKKVLLNLSKKEQQNYQNIIKDREKKAASIRSALFGLRDSASIPFGKALEFATFASQKTGVRPAFLLAILTQETNLGENVGTCNRATDPPTKHWKAIMPGPGDKSKRDDESAYLRITSELGLDPENMPLSCPWNGGWGGAMGPSQFIPTTWEAYKARIGGALGKNPPSPWEPKDAFMATALYMSDLGAGAGGYSAERTAALKYYAGSNWNKKKNAFYGDQVMAKARSIQENMIDPLNAGI